MPVVEVVVLTMVLVVAAQMEGVMVVVVQLLQQMAHQILVLVGELEAFLQQELGVMAALE